MSESLKTNGFSYVPAVMRYATEGDQNFIINSWLKSYRDSNFADPITSDVYFKQHRSLIIDMLSDGVTIVACNPDSTDQIFGWVNAIPSEVGITVFNYVYVKHPYRRLGIGGMLRREALHKCNHDMELPALATHSTRMLIDLLSDKWNIIYNPYLIGASSYGDEKTLLYKIR